MLGISTNTVFLDTIVVMSLATALISTMWVPIAQGEKFSTYAISAVTMPTENRLLDVTTSGVVECSAKCVEVPTCDTTAFEKNSFQCLLYKVGTGTSLVVTPVASESVWTVTKLVVDIVQEEKARNEFIVGFFRNEERHPTTLSMMVGNLEDEDVNVVVTTPLYNPLFQQNLLLHPDDIVSFAMDVNLHYAATDRGIHVEASGDVALYLSNFEKHSHDACAAVSLDYLGDYYIGTTWNSMSEMVILGTEAETDITIELPNTMQNNFIYSGSTYSAGDTISIQLDRYETCQLFGETCDFTGIRISASRKVGVFAGSRKSGILKAGQDHMFDQLMPVDTRGTDFITIGTPSNNASDIFKVVASVDGTQLLIDGTYTDIVNANGEYMQYTFLASEVHSIQASAPIQVTMFSECHAKKVCDPAVGILKPTTRFSKDYLYKPPTDVIHHVVIVSKHQYSGGFTIDGAPLGPVARKAAAGMSDYATATVSVLNAKHWIRNTNPDSMYAVYAFGAEGSTGYMIVLR